jgi:hypothetical protein
VKKGCCDRWSHAALVAVFRAAFVGALIVAPFHLPLSAHHSFAAEFDASKPVTLEGRVARLEWTNPHAWLYLDVEGEDGKVVQWALELSAPNALNRRGFRPDVARPGTKLVVKGYAAKNGTPRARAFMVTLADGGVVELAQLSTIDEVRSTKYDVSWKYCSTCEPTS